MTLPAREAGAPRGVPLDCALAGELAPVLRRLGEGLGAQCPADYSAANFWLFRRAHDWRYIDGDWPHLSGLSYDGERHLLPLFEPERADAATWRALLDGHDGIFPIAEAMLPHYDPALFASESRRDDADYLYPADHFRHYRGTVLQKKRNLMKQFLAAHAVRVEPYAPALMGDALQVLEGWMRDKGKGAGAADDLPCREALADAAGLGLAGFLHYADEAPAGFVLAEPLQPGVHVMRFAKGLERCKGIAQHMFRHYALNATGPLEWLNFEQDLGIANFRRTKLSYRPTGLIAKFRLRWQER